MGGFGGPGGPDPPFSVHYVGFLTLDPLLDTPPPHIHRMYNFIDYILMKCGDLDFSVPWGVPSCDFSFNI